MRILIAISDAGWGGKQQYMYDLVGALADAGHHVVVAGERGGVLAERAARDGRPLLALDSFTDLEGPPFTALRSCLAEERIDVAVASGRRDYLLVHRALEASGRDAALVLVRLSAFPIRETPEYLAVYSRADAIAVLSMQQVDRQFAGLIAAGVVPRDRFHEFRTAVDLRRFTPRQAPPALLAELDIDSGALVIGCVARLSWEKDHATLVRACALAAERHPGLVLLLVGEGEMREPILQLAATLGIAGRLRLTGLREDVPDLLAACRVHVLASTCEETGAIAVQEAMAMGVPVIASRIGVLPDYVRHEETGLLFPPEDAAALAAAIERLADDPALARKLAAGGRREIEERFDLSRLLDRYCRFFAEVHARRGSGTLPAGAAPAAASTGDGRGDRWA